MQLQLPKVIAHRGASAYAPENTLAAFAKAYELGATWIELDVMLTRCGEIVIFHDDSLARTTNARGKLADFDYANLAKLDAGSWLNKKFKGESIPTLAMLIEFLHQYPLGVNIELKPAIGDEMRLVRKLLTTLSAWPEHIPLLLSSFSLRSLELLQEMQEIQGKWPIGLLQDRLQPDYLSLAKSLNCMSIHVNYQHLTKHICETIKNADFLLLSYTVNRLSRAKTLWDWGVDSVFTDYPDRLIS